jgi:hypothetical protein
VVQLVYDPDDSRDCMRRLAELHSLANGCVVCRPPPRPETRGVTTALLRALGKQLRLPETPHEPHRRLQHAAIWLTAEEITDLVVVRADRLAPAAWSMLLDLTRRVPYLTLSLVIRRPALPAGLRATLGDEPTHELDYQELDTPPAGPAPPPPDREPTFPAVPGTDFPLFLSACQQLLDRADAARVLAAHAAEQAHTRAWLRKQHRPRPAMIAGRLAALVGACRDPHEALARLRGAQSALFLAGWLAAFDTGTVIAAHATAHGSPLDDAAIGLLRGYTSTQHAALGVIALASRVPADTIARLTIADIDRRTGSIRIGNRQQVLPVAAARLARAHRLARARNGATTDRPLFTARHAPDRPLKPAGVRRQLRELAGETGLTFAPGDAGLDHEIAVHDLAPRRWRSSTAA